MSLVGLGQKEVVRIKAKKAGTTSTSAWHLDSKSLCVDPQITSYEMLYTLMAKAFNIDGDFLISYVAHDDQGEEVYLSMLSDWDLDAAFFGASEPELKLKIDECPFEDGGDDWDYLNDPESSSSALFTRNTLAKFAQHGPRLSATIGTLGTRVHKTVFRVSKIIGLSVERQDPFCPTKSPMTDSEFRGFLDNVGHVVTPQLFRLSVYQGGVEHSLRKVVWRHLLNIYPDRLSGRERHQYLSHMSDEYRSLCSDWQTKVDDCPTIRSVTHTVHKDVLRTDRTHPYYSGDHSHNIDKLFRILVTYAVTHPGIAYCQGMSDLASPILLVQDDEATTYVCFCALMQRLRSKFTGDGASMMASFSDLRLLLQHHDPDFFAYLHNVHADELIFCYRWLLLELKREFPLDEVLLLLEIMWSSLPPAPPDQSVPLVDPEYFTCNSWQSLSTTSPYIALQSRRHHSDTEVKDDSKDSHASMDSNRSSHESTDPNRLSHKSKDATPNRQILTNEAVQTVVHQQQTDGVFRTQNSQTDTADARACHICTQSNTIDQSSTQSNTIDQSSTQSNTIRGSLTCTDSCTAEGSNSLSSSLSTVTRSALILDGSGVRESSDLELVPDSGNHLSIGFVNVEDKLQPLPPPEVFGQGNPFLMFLCLAVLLNQRDVVMRNQLDHNELAMLFDKMVRQHNVHKVLHQAKGMYASYLKQQVKLREQLEGSTQDTLSV